MLAFGAAFSSQGIPAAAAAAADALAAERVDISLLALFLPLFATYASVLTEL